MPEALVLSGRWLRWVAPDGRIVEERPVDPDPERAAEMLAHGVEGIPPSILEGIRSRPGLSPISVSDRQLLNWLHRHAIAARLSEGADGRRLRGAAFRPDPDERTFLLGVARRRLEEAMRSPEAALIALAREEERIRRVVRRESNAAESWVVRGAPVLADYARVASTTRDRLTQHLDELSKSLDRHAREVAPNLSALVGPLVAARLIAAAGGVQPLARMDGARIQLLGARRRFGPGRSPRFGILYHADGIGQVPPDRAGALARSTAALAAIAVRADAGTRRLIVEELVRRRDRRIVQLRRSGS